MKYCPRCDTEKPDTTEYWYRNSQSRDGLQGYCKMCKSNIHREYMKDPVIRKCVILGIRHWQRTSPKAKLIRQLYDKSPRRVAWRLKRSFSIDGERNLTLEGALSRLDKLRNKRGLL